MTEYVGLALIGLSVVGIIWRSLFLYKKARVQRLVQAFIDELVELYDSESVDKQ